MTLNEIIDIPEFNFRLHITPTEICCYHQLTQVLLDSRKLFNRKIEEVYPNSTFDHFLLRDSRGDEFDLQVMFIKQVSLLETNAEYIRDFYMVTPSHGYYFGLYEIGEFSLTEAKLILHRSYPLEYCNTGICTSDGIFFLAVRESQTLQGPHNYFLYKLHWLPDSDPVILWKKHVSSCIQKFLLKDHKLLLGLQNGGLQIFDLKNEEYLEFYDLFQSSISALIEHQDLILVTSIEGELAAFSSINSILWKTKPSDFSITNLRVTGLDIHFIDRTGRSFLLSKETGLPVAEEQLSLNPSIYSNAVVLNGWIILTDGVGVQIINSTYDSILTYQMSGIRADSYIREFRSHPRGILTGDDSGIIRFWALGQLKSSIFSAYPTPH